VTRFARRLRGMSAGRGSGKALRSPTKGGIAAGWQISLGHGVRHRAHRDHLLVAGRTRPGLEKQGLSPPWSEKLPTRSGEEPEQRTRGEPLPTIEPSLNGSSGSAILAHSLAPANTLRSNSATSCTPKKTFNRPSVVVGRTATRSPRNALPSGNWLPR